jgi:hypothetical protein
MSLKEQQIEQFLQQHGIAGDTTPNPRSGYSLHLRRQEQETILPVDAGSGIEEMTLAAAVWNLIEDAERFGGQETFERWNQENDEGYYERELGLEAALQIYEQSRKVYLSLVQVLGEDLYRALADLILNGKR